MDPQMLYQIKTILFLWVPATFIPTRRFVFFAISYKDILVKEYCVLLSPLLSLDPNH